MVSRRLGFSGAVAALFLLSYPALAEERPSPFNPGHHHRFGHHHHHHSNCDPVIGGGYGVPVVIPGVGTYAGTASVLHVRGNGTYLYAEGYGEPDTLPIEPAPRAKIIDVGRHGSPCSYEAGVCVIRP